ncbi:MAG: CehA/McbA family metallohydrolase [Clostridia bacterium]|nr:CehA/McbA family metallohydrolase [Clostridia bacterium]
MQGKWYKGDTHMHTTNSDGKLRLYQLIDRCKAAGLDWIIVTDHNKNTIPQSYSSDGLTVIQGQEITVHAGHVNIWGAKVPDEPPYEIPDADAYAAIMRRCSDAGATVCLNHPFCSQCGFRVPIDALPADCVEVWNTIQHSDNVRNLDWWVAQLKAGRRLAAVGGSDFHSDIAFLNMIAMPTTVTFAKDNSPAEILASLRAGRSVVTNKPDTSMIELTVGEAILGDTVPFAAGLVGKCRVTKLLPGFELKVFNNDRVVYSHKAKRYEALHEAAFPVTERGFLRAQIDFRLGAGLKRAVGYAEHKYLAPRCETPAPTADALFWAFTNPIWIE